MALIFDGNVVFLRGQSHVILHEIPFGSHYISKAFPLLLWSFLFPISYYASIPLNTAKTIPLSSLFSFLYYTFIVKDVFVSTYNSFISGPWNLPCFVNSEEQPTLRPRL